MFYEAYRVRSKPTSSSSMSAESGRSNFLVLLDGLGIEDLRAGAGLLLRVVDGSPLVPLTGLRSNLAKGVLPVMSAYFQNGAGELVGIC